MNRNSDFCTIFCRHPTGQEERSPFLLVHINIEKKGEVGFAENEIAGLENRHI